MKALAELMNRRELTVIGLMSGTSLDGMDAALVRLTGSGTATKTTFVAFESIPYTAAERETLLRLVEGESGGTHELALVNVWLGQRALEACRAVCARAGIGTDEVDLVGSHGQTLFHIPKAETYLGRQVTATLQLGEASVIAEGMGCPVVSDFRVRDMAAGGQGAPLVPYTEYLLYRSENEHIGLQNIGGIGNLTVLPRGCALDQVYAFDTGPGNMVIDQVVSRLTAGRERWDEDGRRAARGAVSSSLLAYMTDDPYLRLQPPKTTGREMYGEPYVDRLMARAAALDVREDDLVATATRFTAECIGIAWERFCAERPDRLIVGGGGAHNGTLMRMIRERLPIPVQTNEDIGLDSDAKEAVAFAILANECLHGCANNVPRVTGAAHPVVMGKISQ